MFDGWKIIVGLIIFITLATVPFWYDAAAGKGADAPDIRIETKDVPGRDQCVMPAEYMRSDHMELLNEWRDQVVRGNQRVHVTADGRKYSRSLTNTCLDCHSNKDTFCDRCHDYMSVKPYCWECHLEPEVMK